MECGVWERVGGRGVGGGEGGLAGELRGEGGLLGSVWVWVEKKVLPLRCDCCLGSAELLHGWARAETEMFSPVSPVKGSLHTR